MKNLLSSSCTLSPFRGKVEKKNFAGSQSDGVFRRLCRNGNFGGLQNAAESASVRGIAAIMPSIWCCPQSYRGGAVDIRMMAK
jgi:hypothetical protein